MKKTIAAMLTVILCFACTGCSTGESSNNENDSIDSTINTETGENTSTVNAGYLIINAGLNYQDINKITNFTLSFSHNKVDLSDYSDMDEFSSEFGSIMNTNEYSILCNPSAEEKAFIYEDEIYYEDAWYEGMIPTNTYALTCPTYLISNNADLYKITTVNIGVGENTTELESIFPGHPIASPFSGDIGKSSIFPIDPTIEGNALTIEANYELAIPYENLRGDELSYVLQYSDKEALSNKIISTLAYERYYDGYPDIKNYERKLEAAVTYGMDSPEYRAIQYEVLQQNKER